MSPLVLEDVLDMADLSDESDVGIESGVIPSPSRYRNQTIDYSEVMNELLSDTTSDNGSEQAEIFAISDKDAVTGLTEDKSEAKSTEYVENPLDCINVVEFGNNFENNPLQPVVGTSAICDCSEEVSLLRDHSELTQSVGFEIESKLDLQPKETVTLAASEKIEDLNNVKCGCSTDSKYLIQSIARNCTILSKTMKFGVKLQLEERDYRHKLYFIRQVRRNRFDHSSLSKYPDYDEILTQNVESNDETHYKDISKRFLDSIGLPYTTLEDDGKTGDTVIKCRHDISLTLEKLRVFSNGFFKVDSTTVNCLEVASPNLGFPSCVSTNNGLLVIGTLSGSVIVADLMNHNVERIFNPCNESTMDVDTSSDASLNWHEVNTQKGLRVTSLDVLPEANWICVGYDNGMVKLFRYFKVGRAARSDRVKNDDTEHRETDTSAQKQNISKSFGIMADAVSSAFGGFKKIGPQTLCSANVFDDPVLLCKFTQSDSYDEIICCTRKRLAILSYTKTVLSHNLNVNHLQALNERLLDSDELVDIVCLTSNPQSKSLTGKNVEGLVAIVTLKQCIILSTRPALSIVFRVALDKLLHKTLQAEMGTLIPSAAWMVLNNGKSIQPLLLIVVGAQIRFILWDIQSSGDSSSPINCTSLGYIKFHSMICSIHVVMHDILAFIDFNNFLHIVQVNLLGKIMRYDIIKSVNLGEKVELGWGLFDPQWLSNINRSSTIAMHSKTVKMLAKGYKKFSALVAELFQGRRQDSSFELRTVSVFILTCNGVLSIEINSWIKVIGELTASKYFPETLAIICALSEDLIPGLFDFEVFKRSINRLALYVLHQCSAHIIRLSKFMDSASISFDSATEQYPLLDSTQDNDQKEWKENFKNDMQNKIEVLCCSMIDCCISLKLYECLNDLIFRCFSTVNLEQIFANYIILNFFQKSVDLIKLKGPIFESIFDLYDQVLDALSAEYLGSSDILEDQILFFDEHVELANAGICDTLLDFSSGRLKDISDISNRYESQILDVDEHLVIYHVLCNNLCNMQIFCFRNQVDFNNEKAVYRLTKHCLWHTLIYCQSIIYEDSSVLMDILISEASNKTKTIHRKLESSLNELRDYEKGNIDHGDVDAILMIPCEVSEKLFIIRVLYLALNSFLTFENCRIPDNNNNFTKQYCNITEFLTSTRLFKPTFPIKYSAKYAKVDLQYDDATIDFDNMDTIGFKSDLMVEEDSDILFKLLCLSSRLLFVCFCNLFMNCDDKFCAQGYIIGSKIENFNFILDKLVACTCKLESAYLVPVDVGREVLRDIKVMTSVLILGTSLFSENFFITHTARAISIYTLLTLEFHSKDIFCVNTCPGHSKELVLPSGYFNNMYYYSVFCKSDPELREKVRQMHLTQPVIEELIKSYLSKHIRDIYSQFGCKMNWTVSSHYNQLKNFCKGILSLAKTCEIRLFLYEIIGDFGGIILEYKSSGQSASIFSYLKDCIQYIKLGTCLDPFKVDKNANLLLLDRNVQKDFMIVIMDNLPMLIELNLEKVTDLLSQFFSLEDMVKTFNDSTMQVISQDTILNNLKDFPDLQLLVLDSILNSKSSNDIVPMQFSSYFNKYLDLLCFHDQANVCAFLKKQKTLNITDCLSICKRNDVKDAIIYLLVRAGNFEEASIWLLKSFSNNINDLEKCLSLVDYAYLLCHESEKYMSKDIIENLWFGILETVVRNLKKSPEIFKSGFPGSFGDKICKLIDYIFALGILKFTKSQKAITEIIRYETSLELFNLPLHNILSDLEFQTFLVNNSVDMSNVVLNKQFRKCFDFNKKGVIINMLESPDPKLQHGLACKICGKSLIYTFKLDAHCESISKKSLEQNNSLKFSDKRKLKTQFSSPQRQSMLEMNNISHFEQQVGIFLDLKIQNEGNTLENFTLPQVDQQGIQIADLYNDRLSTFVNRKCLNSPNKTNWNRITPYLAPQLIKGISKKLRKDCEKEQHINVFWCGHVFHEKCAPLACPMCNIND